MQLLDEPVEAVAAERPSVTLGETVRLAALALLPLVILAGVLVGVAHAGLPATASVPLEELTVERVLVTDDGFVVHARNTGRDPVEVAQVAVNDLLVGYTVEPEGEVPRLGKVVYTVPYRWVEAEPYEIALLTAGGFKFSAEVDAAFPTPRPDARTFGVLALLGVYVGVVPVLAGLLWRPVLERVSERVVRVALGFTLGLLGFLALDTFLHGLAVAALAPGVFEPVILLVAGAVAAYALLVAVGERLRRRAGAAPLTLAALVAVGVGLHNLAEGLAIGGAFAVGEAALGVALVVGFAIHNTTEGLAIVSPLTGRPVTVLALVGLGLVAGVPTILGAWAGGFTTSPSLALALLAVGVGAIAAVVVEIDRAWAGALRRGGAAIGAAVGFAFMYVTGLFVVI